MARYATVIRLDNSGQPVLNVHGIGMRHTNHENHNMPFVGDVIEVEWFPKGQMWLPTYRDNRNPPNVIPQFLLEEEHV